jgi:hypothetical protein
MAFLGADALPGLRMDACEQGAAEHRHRDTEREHGLLDLGESPDDHRRGLALLAYLRN